LASYPNEAFLDRIQDHNVFVVKIVLSEVWNFVDSEGSGGVRAMEQSSSHGSLLEQWHLWNLALFVGNALDEYFQLDNLWHHLFTHCIPELFGFASFFDWNNCGSLF